MALGLFVLFYLTDRPKHAHWLQPDERDWIANTLENERLAKQDTAPRHDLAVLSPAAT